MFRTGQTANKLAGSLSTGEVFFFESCRAVDKDAKFPSLGPSPVIFCLLVPLTERKAHSKVEK